MEQLSIENNPPKAGQIPELGVVSQELELIMLLTFVVRLP
jgi:hypothetical protein